ncbi:flagellar basal body-associated FliL family protein [bacterium]|nr:flagellar basal body-associated FliL family protein [bacterium]
MRPRRGGAPLMLIIAGAVAVLALAAAGFLFMQMQGMKKKLALEGGPQPRGLEPAAEEEHSSSEDVMEETAHVTYELGKFTANTADGRHATMTIALSLESFYSSEDWATYEGMMEAYEHQLDFYNQYQRGEVDESGKPKKKGKDKGGHASLPGEEEGDGEADPGPATVLAAYRPGGPDSGAGGAVEHSHPGVPAGTIPASGGHGKKAEPPKLPEEVPLPKTIFAKQLDEKTVEVRDLVIDEINRRSAGELSSPEGKAAFKEALIEGIGTLIDAHYGKVLEVYLPEIVTG